ALADRLDDDARATGAVNTLVFENDAVSGMNTDVQGFASSLAESFGPAIARTGPAAVLGAGGAARAIVHALLRAGGPEIRLINRTEARAESLAAQTQNRSVSVLPWGEWANALKDVRLLINTTSMGMKGKPVLAVSLGELPPEAVVADIVYNPLE